MKTFTPSEFGAQQAIQDGAWQSRVFGPSLLDEAGKAKTDFITWDYIRESHPRTAIGYYEPGHYCLLVVDGRQKDYSRGMFLTELSKLFESLGCKAAYNLDGGVIGHAVVETHCSSIKPSLPRIQKETFHTRVCASNMSGCTASAGMRSSSCRRSDEQAAKINRQSVSMLRSAFA